MGGEPCRDRASGSSRTRGQTVCERFKESMQRFRKSLRKVSYLFKKKCMKFEIKCASYAQEVRKSSHKVCEVYQKVCTISLTKSVYPPISVHKVEHEHTFCEQCTLVHTLGISVLRAAR
jgi:hypothetical protein